MSSKKHIIKYESSEKTHPNVLVQMKTLIPQWYKDLTLFHNNQLVDENDFQIKKTLKHCTPTLDAFISGYAITLPYDIVISYDGEGNPILSGKHGGNQLAKVRGRESNKTRPIPHGYNKTELAWSLPLAISVPSGCSFILTHPFNRFDLPFLTLSGIVDGGFVLNAQGDVPFYIKEGFHGVIEKGTPIAQIVPFEHSRWKSEESKGLVQLGEITKENIGSKIVHSWYRSTWWVKKKYD
jgi:hypothetical protein